MSTTKGNLTFIPLHPTFGAECDGVDFSQPVPADTIAQIRITMATYGVLVFRATALDDARHTAFAAQFGELDVSTVITWPGTPYRLGPHSQLTDVGNIDNKGHVESATSLRAQAFRGNGLFHVDCSFHQRRAGYSLLRAHQLPPLGKAGATVFADTRTAYADLDEATKAQIQDFVLWHSILHSRCLAVPHSWAFKAIDWVLDIDNLYLLSYWMILALTTRSMGFLVRPADISLLSMLLFCLVRVLLMRLAPKPLTARAAHPLVQLHKPSDRMNLYIAAHAYRIHGQTKSASQPVIEALLRHAAQDKYTFTVDWQNNGDLIVWDNTCVMHRSHGGSYHGQYVRDMRRATVYDSA
ncbi:alpha-ketoglutarate-dependent 2,4-dichlorophenoxyacetate dioxygenase [Ilyonectria destructans]|nr:alpha-ketoglutarate-dependent 2,4-dichlorophenoxyacetate dioxygenase [Ilyonectria destructans]